MQPAMDQAWTSGLLPMTQGQVGEMEGLRLTAEPFHAFMAANVRGADLQLFLDLGQMAAPPTPDQAQWRALVHLAGRSAPILTALTRRAVCRSWST
jgi:flagellar biosynthetic protein FliP